MIKTPELTQDSRKIRIFEEFLGFLYLWYYQEKGLGLSEPSHLPPNDLSKLKVIKLHFFAVTTVPEAITLFNSFYALPYGHVETEIYSRLDSLNNFKVTNTELILTNPHFLDTLDANGLANQMIDGLRRANPKIITYSAFQLVNLSHKWFSWRHNYSQAREQHSKARKISPETIQHENKYYRLGN